MDEEVISAFAAYLTNGKGKQKTTSKASKDNKKNSPGKKGKKTTAKQGGSGAKDSKSNGHKTTETAKINGNESASTSKKAPSCPRIYKAKEAAQAEKSKTTVKQKGAAAATTTKKPQPKKKNSNQNGGGIKENEVDQLVEELMGDSPSNPKKLTQAQKKKRKELEEYLVKQLENMDDEDSYTEEDDNSSVSSDDDDEIGSDEFSEEFTINTTQSSFDDDDETGIASKSDTEDSEAEVKPKKGSNGKPKTSAQKRKSAGAVASTSKENTTETAKKSKNGEGPFQKLTKPRQSLTPQLNSTPKQTVVVAAEKAAASRKVKTEPFSPVNAGKMNSITEGKKIFQWLLDPITPTDFFDKYWEKNSCLIKRHQSNYFSHLISFVAIDQMLINNHVEFTKNIDVTSYKNGVRETLNPEGRAMPPAVWDHYGQGCSIRLLNPHTFLPSLFSLNTTLQEYFHCLVGANAYLTPPNSQGFAPHYDDIEAFVLQVEGRKRWRLYKPRNSSEALPRYSSPNFTQEEIGNPILEEVLQPGDVLYFPRGTIHQAYTEPGYHSLHITLSVYQKQSYADLFERMFPMVLQRAIANNVDLRRGLPLHTWQHAGIAFSNNDTQERAEFLQMVTRLVAKCLRDVTMSEVMDAAVDQLAKKFQHEALPPEILPSERVRTVFGSRNRTNENGDCVCDYDIDIRTNVRPLRANIMRLVEEEAKIRIYYYLDNSKEYCEYEPNFIEIEAQEAASVEVLIKSYPHYVSVSQLPLDNDEHKIQVVTALWERGLLMMEKPFK